MYLRARRGISYLPQEPSVFRKMTVEDNLRAIFQTLDLTPPERRRRTEELIQDFGLIAATTATSCPAASAGASRSRARWQSAPATCSSTSRSRGSIR